MALAVDPVALELRSFSLYLLSWYLTYSLGMLALVWAPIRFATGWSVAVHVFDTAAFILLVAVTRANSSAFFPCLLFLLVCASLRWHAKGVLWTAAVALVGYAAISFYAHTVLSIDGFEFSSVLAHAVYVAIVTGLLTTLSAHQHRFQREIGQIAAWPRQVSRDPRAVVSEMLSQISALLDAPSILLAWEEGGDSDLKLAWLAGREIRWAEASKSEYDPLVAASLEGKSFQATDATLERGPVVVHSARGFRRRDGRPVNEVLRSRFEMMAVQSWAVEGELVRGRLFCINKAKMGIDDLIVGELVAGQVASRLDSTLILGRLRDAAALEERVRVAGDLHDSLLQAQAGAALQLLAARRLLDQRPDAARRGLEEVQNLLERGELEMRSFIRGLRPASNVRPKPINLDLAGRLETLRQRVERQWTLVVNLRLGGAAELVPAALRDDVYHLAQEAIINAARHADAQEVTVTMSATNSELTLHVADDGRGFPFHGTFDLDVLNKMKAGPLTLKERVSRLAGRLTLRSLDTGSIVSMTLPLGSPD